MCVFSFVKVLEAVQVNENTEKKADMNTMKQIVIFDEINLFQMCDVWSS